MELFVPPLLHLPLYFYHYTCHFYHSREGGNPSIPWHRSINFVVQSWVDSGPVAAGPHFCWRKNKGSPSAPPLMKLFVPPLLHLPLYFYHYTCHFYHSREGGNPSIPWHRNINFVCPKLGRFGVLSLRDLIFAGAKIRLPLRATPHVIFVTNLLKIYKCTIRAKAGIHEY